MKAEIIPYQADRQSSEYIEDGVLLQKYRRCADQYSRHNGYALPGSRLKLLRVQRCKQHCQCTDYMDRRADVGMGIKLVEAGEKARKYIISLKPDGAQVLAGREDKVYKYRRRIRKYDKLHIFFECTDVIQQGIKKHPDQRNKPEKIRDYKELIEGNQIIYRTVHGIICTDGIESFYIQKQQAINRPVEQKLQMTEFVGVELVDPE